jgi:hypothetical protein
VTSSTSQATPSASAGTAAKKTGMRASILLMH